MGLARTLPFTAIVLVCAARGEIANADPSADQARAKQLYDDGTAAMKSKDYPAACKKFQESYRISGIAGALLSWADCEESAGHVGTAFNLWNEGSALVVRDADRRAFVEQRIQAISARVPHVHISVVSPEVAQVHATLDGASVDATKPITADPGEHKIIVSAPGFADETASVSVDFGETKDVPVFATPHRVAGPSVGTPGPPGPAPPPHDSGNATLRTAGWIVGGVGLAGAVSFGATAGAVFGLCKGRLGQCAAKERSTVGALNIVNALSLGVGIAGLATGGVLIGVGSRGSASPPPASTTAIYVGPANIGLRGTF